MMIVPGLDVHLVGQLLTHVEEQPFRRLSGLGRDVGPTHRLGWLLTAEVAAVDGQVCSSRPLQESRVVGVGMANAVRTHPFHHTLVVSPDEYP